MEMSSLSHLLAAALLTLFGLVQASTFAEDKEKLPPIVGRWDINVQSPKGLYPSWLEVRRSGYTTLVGTFVGQVGSARPISRVEFENGHVRFSVPPQWEKRKDDLHFEGMLEGGRLRGETTDEKGQRLTWTASRAPSLKREAQPEWDQPIQLIGDQGLAGWKSRGGTGQNNWVVRSGMLVNTAAGNDLFTERTFTDFKLHVEFRYPAGSNSGVYLRGRYEVQIEDNYGEEPECHRIGAIYGFLTPAINAAKPAGEWQSFDIELVGRVVTVIFNGERIIDRQTIPGITGGALDSDEATPGPILVQGDHGPIDFRNLTITPAK
jgi:hypothetical protein